MTRGRVSYADAGHTPQVVRHGGEKPAETRARWRATVQACLLALLACLQMTIKQRRGASLAAFASATRPRQARTPSPLQRAASTGERTWIRRLDAIQGKWWGVLAEPATPLSLVQAPVSRAAYDGDSGTDPLARPPALAFHSKGLARTGILEVPGWAEEAWKLSSGLPPGPVALTQGPCTDAVTRPPKAP